MLAPSPCARILVVDDEPEMCRLIVRILGDHEVTTTCVPGEALAAIRAGARFDLILSDVMMPRLTGIALHAAITSVDPGLATRIVFITASVLTEALEQQLSALPNQVLRKPFGIRELRELVRARVG